MSRGEVMKVDPSSARYGYYRNVAEACTKVCQNGDYFMT